MRFEKLKESLDLLVHKNNLGFEIFDLSGEKICGYANMDGEQDSRGAVLILEKKELTVFFPRNPTKYNTSKNFTKISPNEGEFQIIVLEQIGRIRFDIWGMNEFAWSHVKSKNKEIYYTF